MAFRHPVVDFDEFRIHIIGNPSRLPSRWQQQIKTKLVPVTKRAFGGKRPVKPFEVGLRTTHPEVSLLLYVDRVPEGGNPRASIGNADAVGYLSAKHLLGNTMHIYAAAMDPEFQRHGIYEMCKRLAMTLLPIQLRLHGGKPAFYTAQSPYLHIHRGLLEEQGMQPAQYHEHAERLKTHATLVANALGEHGGFNPDTGIRRAAFPFNPYEGLNPEQVQTLLKKEATKFKDPDAATRFLDVFKQMDFKNGDALLSIREYHPQDARMWRNFAELTGPDTQGAVLAELLLGEHRREIASVHVIPTTKKGQPPHISIQFKPGKWDSREFRHRIENHSDIRRRGAVKITNNGIETHLNRVGLHIVSTALACTTRKAKRT